MNQLLHRLLGSKAKPTSLEPGLFAYQNAVNGKNVRLHLRLLANGEGLLIINAATVLKLNQTAAEYAFLYINRKSPEEAVNHITSRYRQVTAEDAKRDYLNFDETVQQILFTQDLDPVLTLGMSREDPYSDEQAIPLRLDCALTYRLPESSSSTAAPNHRVVRELTTSEWIKILDSAWTAGIPHIIFTGGEPTLRDDLSELIRHAEANGQVTGLLTDGHKLSDAEYMKNLLNSGLDHTLIVLTPDDHESWEGISSFSYWRSVLDEDLFVGVHLTITDDNVHTHQSIISRLAEMGISALSLSANDASHAWALTSARDFALGLGLELIWDLPVPYSNLNPVELEFLMDSGSNYVSGAGRGWFYIEPDGDVLPGQGISHKLGNLTSNTLEDVIAAAREFANHP